MQTLDILQSAELLAKHQATQEDQSIDSLYRVEVPRIQELQLRREQHGRHAPRVSLPSRRSYCHF